MAQNDPWQQMVGNPLDRMLALTCHDREQGMAGKRLFVTLRDCNIEERNGYTRLVMKKPKGTYYYVVDTPEEIFAMAGLPCPQTTSQRKADKQPHAVATPGS